MKKEIPLRTDEHKFFRQYVTLLSNLINLRDKEAAVLAELLYYQFKFKELPEDVKWKMVFDYDTKLKIREAIGLSQASLDNIFTALRKKKIIDPNENKLGAGYVVYPEFPFELTFKFIIK